MPYDLKSLSDTSLKQLAAVIEDIDHKSALLNKRGPLGFADTVIAGVNRDEQKLILDRLESDGFIDFSVDGNLIWIREPFWDFYDEVHHETHRLLKPVKADVVLDDAPHYDEINGAMYIRGNRIQIKHHDEDTKQNQLLRHIFITNAKDTAREFDFTEFSFDDVWDKKKNKEICRTACTAINAKIAKGTQNTITDFLQFNTRTYGWLKVNPEYTSKQRG